MFEWLAPSFIYGAGKDLVRLVWPKKLTPAQVIERRQKWKPLFEQEIVTNWRDKLRRDVVIRDMRRIDKYPDVEEGAKGISPWFRVGLIDTYHRGILVAFQWAQLVEEQDGGFREYQHGVDNDNGLKVLHAAKIPFENIENVDFKGDQFYPYPHIYCYFTIKGQPYESIGYYEERENPGGRPFYTLVADQEDVLRRSPHLTRRLSVWRRLRLRPSRRHG